MDKYSEIWFFIVLDWYLDKMLDFIVWFMSKVNLIGVEFVLDLGLFNDEIDVSIMVSFKMIYCFDVINMGVFVSVYFWFEGYNMIIIMIDGIYIYLVEVNMIYVIFG